MLYGYMDPETKEYRQEERTEPPEMKLCDFCSTAEIFKLYPNRETVEALPGVTDSGGWTACRACAALVDAENWEDLADRSTDTFMQTYQLDKSERPELRNAMREIHRGFRQNRGFYN